MDEPEPPGQPSSPYDDHDATRTVMQTETRAAPDAGAPRLTPGQRFGRYRIERLLGRGGMGEVYEAEDLESGRRLALKILLRSMADTADRDRFLREGRLAAAVSHPHTVYVYGTEQIEGVPTIAMELASGGTLKGKVRAGGALAPDDAVDAMLQVIAGLDAAARVDVLHRDIKPSNCFVGLDGTVKVGDFGLSISTLGHDHTHLTVLGTLLGTPAFASPEQLREGELDVRSDIYSVGATLYYLLTGQAPFEDANIATLITRVVGETPMSPDAVQPGITSGLAGVVLRCLAKDPTKRPASYQQLADALEPYSSRAPTPGALGRRCVAGALDLFVLGLLGIPAGLLSVNLFLGNAPPAGPLAVFNLVANIAPYVLYFGLLEGLWGTTPGKRTLGLRVIGVDRSAPGLRRGMLRALVYGGLSQGPEQIPILVLGFEGVGTLAEASPLFGVVLGLLSIVGPVALFSTMRARNGFATLHGLASRTRVVAVASDTARTTFDVAVDDSTAPAGAPLVGGYELLETTDAALALGHDPQLRRRVWIHRPGPGAAPVAAARRDANRPGRARWLAGRRAEGEAWDVYEAFGGRPIGAFTERPLAWETVRHWVADLATELQVAKAEGTLPVLALDRVWITPDGRARLLDWPAPGADLERPAEPLTTPTGPEAPASVLGAIQQFLAGVTTFCLTADRPGHRATTALPLGAHAVIGRLMRGEFASEAELANATGALVRGPAAVSRRDRALHLAGTGFLPIVITVSVLAVAFLLPVFLPEVDQRLQFELSLAALEELEDDGELTAEVQARRRALEVQVADGLRTLRTLDSTLGVSLSFTPSDDQQPLIDRIVAAHPDPSPEEVSEAGRILGEAFGGRNVVSGIIRQALPVAIVVWLFGAPLIALVSAVVCRGGLLLRMLGIALVTQQGAEAARGRVFLRTAIAWLPAIGAAVAGFYAFVEPLFEEQDAALLGLFWVSGTVFVIGALYAIVDTERGFQDRIAGTYLVPK